QYLSAPFLKALMKEKKEDELILGIVEVDLYTPGLNFIFGEAAILAGVAIIALARLHQSFYGLLENEELFKSRTLKEAVHELGHLFGLPHCSNPRCVMHFSNSILDTDKKSAFFCDNCKRKIK
ncbi:MAG TPA: archemetzincin, partial [Candidatus Desulfofervidus auxilii]|nr:archemetzincin [Candidatus Desulfofervidus auxilii]